MDIIEKLETRKKFFEMWYDTHPEMCELNLLYINLELKKHKNGDNNTTNNTLSNDSLSMKANT